MKRRLAAGPGSLAGLRWLASVGAAPLDAWQVAMGWAGPTAYSHAARLVAAGWAARCSMARGSGSLLYATPTGVRVAGVLASAMAREPAPTWWSHCQACAWTAAWLTARGRRMLGSRELLIDDFWRGELEWQERGGLRRRAHRPDLVGGLAGGPMLPIEVELASKSKARLRSVLSLHAAWIAAGKTGAVVYVCGSGRLAERVRAQAAEVGLWREQKTIRIELLADIRAQAIAARGDG